jgi:hypothetical protein
VRYKKAVLKSGTSPITKGLPSAVAASIGRTVVRHSYLEWSLAKTIYNLLGISIKQGRAAVRLPAINRYVATVETLMEHLDIQIVFNFNTLGKKIVAADNARNTLAHSIFVRDKETKQLKIQLVHGNWELDQHTIPVSRVLNPEGKPVDRRFLAEKRATVEAAICVADELRRLLNAQLQALNEKRHTRSAMDRRQSHRT